jgi:hypothetical protein
MTVYGSKGQVVHHDNCTYCLYRECVPMPGKGKREVERCRITNLPLPEVAALSEIHRRYCQDYKQVNCLCLQCCKLNNGIYIHQLVDK